MTTTTQPAPRIAASADSEAIWFLGGRMTVLLASEHTGGRASVMLQELPAGLATPLHRQPDDETFYVLDGRIELWIEGERGEAGPGDVAYVPAGVRHAFRVLGDGARLLDVNQPGGHEAFMRAGGLAVAEHPEPPAGPLDVDRLAAAAAAAGVELLGPPPFGD